MTEETERSLAVSVGKIEANMEEFRSDTKKLISFITGDSNPEDGILFKITELVKVHRTCPLITGQLHKEVLVPMAERIQALENARKTGEAVDTAVADATSGTVDIKPVIKMWDRIKPVLMSKVTWVILTAGGGTLTAFINKSSILKFLYEILKKSVESGQ